MNKATWLHLSDLHFKSDEISSWNEKKVLEKLLKDITKQINKHNFALDFIFFTGDTAFKGASEEYEIALEFFQTLMDSTNVRPERLFIVPGNHDVQERDKIPNLTKKGYRNVESVDEINELFANKEQRKIFSDKFKNYRKFIQNLNNIPKNCKNPSDIPFHYAETVNRGSNKIGILGLNTSLLSMDDKDEKNLFIGKKCLKKVLKKKKKTTSG